jgi:hypothetical protein
VKGEETRGSCHSDDEKQLVAVFDMLLACYCQGLPYAIPVCPCLPERMNFGIQCAPLMEDLAF